MTLQIRSLSEIIKNPKGATITLYGSQESGKSSLALTLSKNYKTLYFDTEGMAIPLLDKMPPQNINKDNISVIDGEKQLQQVDAFLSSPQVRNFDCIIIDSVSHLVESMIAHENPATLTGNGVFAYYRDIGRFALFIIEKCKSMGITCILTFQSTKDKKGYEGVNIPEVDGNEILSKIRKLSNLMIYLEGSKKGEKTAWLDTSDNFAMTKSKLLKADHPEKIVFEGLENFSMETILDGVTLPKKEVAKPVTKEQLAELKVLVTEGNKYGKIDKEKMFEVIGIDNKPYKDLDNYEFEIVKERLIKRNNTKKEEFINN